MTAVKKMVPEKDVIANAISVGLFSKKEAALQIARGSKHVHSTALGSSDPLAILSESATLKNTSARYPWENIPSICTSDLQSSQKRRECIASITDFLQLEDKRSMREKVELILEELITNGIYHAYLNKNGNEKYQRKSSVELAGKESICICYGFSPEGIYLSVTDKGGGVPFPKLAKAFERCYTAREGNQIESKEGGAGLGLYMVFETATHVKITSQKTIGTTVSCWIANKSSFIADHFSFNYFEEGPNE